MSGFFSFWIMVLVVLGITLGVLSVMFVVSQVWMWIESRIEEKKHRKYQLELLRRQGF